MLVAEELQLLLLMVCGTIGSWLLLGKGSGQECAKNGATRPPSTPSVKAY